MKLQHSPSTNVQIHPLYFLYFSKACFLHIVLKLHPMRGSGKGHSLSAFFLVIVFESGRGRLTFQ